MRAHVDSDAINPITSAYGGGGAAFEGPTLAEAAYDPGNGPNKYVVDLFVGVLIIIVHPNVIFNFFIRREC